MRSICGNSCKTVGKAIQENLSERMAGVCKSVEANVATLKNLKYNDLFNTFFWLIHDSMCCYFIVLSSLLFYNIENSKNKETLE